MVHMGRARLPAAKKRSRMAKVTLTPGEEKLVQEAADAEELTLSEFGRRAMLDRAAQVLGREEES